ncbi:hypothetical protein [Gimesia sp.]|uniref:hypothetical protein n=1 Tax=Gimesia sp. TaxID=2024833 RepID=UPI000C4E78B5|nr:hypothetical protein [Gimesia sp.]MAX35224.1 hypothetical protein [Gimesia sp.]HAH48240.1 hypothetical protein [Planctomycetaceae bacterium]HBL45350.1 hypothetical protein [Planctomycetaceae bacterium]|tara:strand:+ start:218 stop:640 length:423 start_codon:yes stop_codon:yes gene_type:complete
MTDKRASQLNLIGALFLVLGLISIFSLVILRNIGDQVKENAEATANLTSLDGMENDRSDQFDSIQRSMLLGMWIWTVFFSLICFMTGVCILRRISHRSCLVGAAVICIVFPLGTVLGAWTLFVLTSRETKALFSENGHDT